MCVLGINMLEGPGKEVVTLTIPDSDHENDVALTVLIAQGQTPKPVLAVLAAVHGDEYEGVLAIQDVFRAIDPEKVRGTLVALPVANPPAYKKRTRNTPTDGKDLARVFPGSPDGTVTERIAYCISSQIIQRADFLLDLHSGGTSLSSPTLVGYCEQLGLPSKVAAEAARSFGAPVVRVLSSATAGSTISLAADLGIPALYTEANGGMRVDLKDLSIYSNGISNVMGYLKMLERPTSPPPRCFLGGGGGTDDMLTFRSEGIFRPTVQVLQSVRQGDRIGYVRGLDGGILEEILSPRAGRVVFLRAVPPVSPGEKAVLIADELMNVGLI